MTSTRSGFSPILTPEEVGTLVVRPLIIASIAGQVLTTVQTQSSSYRIPVVTADPSASWVAEGAEITASDAVVDEVVVTPTKLAGLSVVSSELAEDSDPAALTTVGDGLVRDLTRKLDQALFAASTTNGPAGLPGLSGIQTVSAGATYANADSFSDSVYLAANANANITAFVTNPATAQTLSKVKEATGSNKPLLGADPSKPGQRQILGVPLLTSPYVTTTNSPVWGISAAFSYLVIRDDAAVESDSSVFFSSDRVAIRAKLRVGFGFAHPQSIVKITTSA
jgi:HK97 family phage major capsid protein